PISATGIQRINYLRDTRSARGAFSMLALLRLARSHNVRPAARLPRSWQFQPLLPLARVEPRWTTTVNVNTFVGTPAEPGDLPWEVSGSHGYSRVWRCHSKPASIK